MLNVIKSLLSQLINDIDAGNSRISESEQEEVINLLGKLLSDDLSKTEAADYLGVCRATFDNYINNGWIPKGTKRPGFKELSWKRFDLDKFNNSK